MKPNPNNPHTTLTTTPPTRQPAIIIEAARDDYAIRFSLRHRKSWRKLTPSQRGIILLAGATQLETWASQMRTSGRRPRRRLTRHANPRYHTIPQDTDMQHILPKHGTRAYGYPTVAGCNANRTPITCPFCSGPTIVDGFHIIIHREYLGYTLCPASGKTPTEGAVLATALLDDYLLPNESSYSDQ